MDTQRSTVSEWRLPAPRALCWAGLVLMVFINFYAAPRAKWIDRDISAAAAIEARLAALERGAPMAGAA